MVTDNKKLDLLDLTSQHIKGITNINPCILVGETRKHPKISIGITKYLLIDFRLSIEYKVKNNKIIAM